MPEKDLYKFYDIPSVMLASVKEVVNKGKPACVCLTGAETIKDEVEEAIKDSQVKVIYAPR